MFKKDTTSKLTVDHFTCILYNALCCLNFLESANVIHRDLKPNNILITDECAIVICDFGFARTMPKDHNSTRLDNEIYSEDSDDQKPVVRNSRFERANDTGISRQLTPHVFHRWYRPAEVIMIPGNYSFSSELWSIGCIMAEFLNLISKRPKDPHQTRTLFPGKFCHPMSPR